MMHQFSVAAVLWSTLVGAAAARQDTPPQPIDTPQMTITVTPAKAIATPGKRVSLRLDVNPKPRMHVYAPAQKDYIPVSLTLDRSEDYTIHAPEFPPAEKFFFKPLNETQLVYSKPFRIVQDVTVARTAALRARSRRADALVAVTGTLRYQACDDVVCYPPRNVPVRWTLSLRAPRP